MTFFKSSAFRPEANNYAEGTTKVWEMSVIQQDRTHESRQHQKNDGLKFKHFYFCNCVRKLSHPYETIVKWKELVAFQLADKCEWRRKIQKLFKSSGMDIKYRAQHTVISKNQLSHVILYRTGRKPLSISNSTVLKCSALYRENTSASYLCSFCTLKTNFRTSGLSDALVMVERKLTFLFLPHPGDNIWRCK